MKKLSILLLAVFFIGIANLSAQNETTTEAVVNTEEVKEVKKCSKTDKICDATCNKNKKGTCCKGLKADKGSYNFSDKGSFNFSKSNNYTGKSSCSKNVKKACCKKKTKTCGEDCTKACCAKNIPKPPAELEKTPEQ